MPLSAIDKKPPPLFRQGPSAHTKLVLFAALALFLMAADTRLKVGAAVRATIATALLPVQRALQWPLSLAEQGRGYTQGVQQAQQTADSARAQLSRQAVLSAEAELLRKENTQLRQLLDLRAALQVRSIPAEALYEAPDLYSRKVFIDRGERHGVRAGAPVVNQNGVLGQVTAVFPLSSVVTLLVDRHGAVPVVNQRTQVRSAVHGTAEGRLELRFMVAAADVQVGDVIVTSGIDAVYPPGLMVGKVASVERRAQAGFARVVVQPAGPIDGVRHMLVLEPMGEQLPPMPADAFASAPVRPAKGAKAAAAAAASAAAPASAAGASPARPGTSAAPRPPANPASGAGR